MTGTRVSSPGMTEPTQRGFSSRLIGEVMVDLGLVTPAEVDQAVAEARDTGRPMGRVLLDQGTITDDQLARAVAERHGLDHVDLVEFEVDMEVARLIPPAMARRHAAVPIARIDASTILVAMAEPSNVRGIDDIALLTDLRVAPAIASSADIHLLISRLGGSDVALSGSADAAPVDEGLMDYGQATQEIADAYDEAPIVRFVHSIIQEAIERCASDVHFSPYDGSLRCEFRIDGVLLPATTVPRGMMAGVVSRMKLMGHLDIAERRAPQDGRMTVMVEGEPVDIRIVSLPVAGGETVVLRILNRRDGALDLAELGMPASEREALTSALDRPRGAVLVTGPTGSGKTTTLYSALRRLNTGLQSIITIEDPVEYRLDGVKQMQVNPKAGVTFATGLRSIMRADPDVVMVGEIRDAESAQIAVEAGLTGHLVLSTLHANDAPSTVVRMVEMGIEAFLVASVLECVVAQRLVRRLCPDCKHPAIVEAAALRANGFEVHEDIAAFEPTGCGRCNKTGYRGRVGLYEVMQMTDDLRDAIQRREPASALGAHARCQGMRALPEQALDKVREGATSIAEVLRVIGRSAAR